MAVGTDDVLNLTLPVVTAPFRRSEIERMAIAPGKEIRFSSKQPFIISIKSD
jgi:hypothetical protein